MHDLTITELDTELIEMLPERETLSGFFSPNWAAVYATNSSLALNIGTIQSAANSAAVQNIAVVQG